MAAEAGLNGQVLMVKGPITVLAILENYKETSKQNYYYMYFVFCISIYVWIYATGH